MDKKGVKIMKKFLAILFVLALISTSFASNIVSKPTVSLALDQSNASNTLTSAQYTYLTGQLEYPLTSTSELIVALQMGNNYGVSSTGYRLGYKFELN